MSAPTFEVGQQVHVTNDYGVDWGRKTIVAIDEDKWGAMYYLAPDDAPWMHWRASNLRALAASGETP